MRVITNVMIVVCEYGLLLIMYLLMVISGMLLWLMNRIGEASAGIHECIDQLHRELYS